MCGKKTLAPSTAKNSATFSRRHYLPNDLHRSPAADVNNNCRPPPAWIILHRLLTPPARVSSPANVEKCASHDCSTPHVGELARPTHVAPRGSHQSHEVPRLPPAPDSRILHPLQRHYRGHPFFLAGTEQDAWSARRTALLPPIRVKCAKSTKVRTNTPSEYCAFSCRPARNCHPRAP